MNSMSLSVTYAAQQPGVATLQWRRCSTALAATLGLHLGLGALLLTHWQVDEPPPPQIRSVHLQLLTLSPPVQPVTPEPVIAPAEPAPPDPAIERQHLEQAALARKRAEQQRIEQEQQRQREAQRREQERQRREAEAREQQAQQRLAEQRAQAERQQQAAAAAAERAQVDAAAAASSEFLPIAKRAPDYPQRALDKGLQGQCTVHYRVNEQGRVENPEAEADCHPLFIRPSLNAAKSFRYQPRVVDGHAVAVPNVRNTFTYRIQ